MEEKREKLNISRSGINGRGRSRTHSEVLAVKEKTKRQQIAREV